MYPTIIEYIEQNPVEVFAALTGVVSIWLNTRVSKWGWIWGIASIIPYLYIFFTARLYQDFLLHVFYLGMSVYGFWSWVFRRTASGKQLPISWSTRQELLILLLLGAFGTGASGYFFANYTDADLPYWDAFTTVFSLIGTWLLAQKRMENWLVWLLVNTCAIGVYGYKGLYITAALYSIYWLLAWRGWWRWQHLKKATEAHNQAPAA